MSIACASTVSRQGLTTRVPGYNLRTNSMSHFEQDFLISYGDEDLLSELKRLARALKRDGLSRRDIDENGRVSSGTVIKRFGSLRKALQAAGLKPIRFMKASDEELLGILIDLWTRTLEKEGRRTVSPRSQGLRFCCFLGHGCPKVRVLAERCPAARSPKSGQSRQCRSG